VPRPRRNAQRAGRRSRLRPHSGGLPLARRGGRGRGRPRPGGLRAVRRLEPARRGARADDGGRADRDRGRHAGGVGAPRDTDRGVPVLRPRSRAGVCLSQAGARDAARPRGGARPRSRGVLDGRRHGGGRGGRPARRDADRVRRRAGRRPGRRPPRRHTARARGTHRIGVGGGGPAM
ncbi:MAG: hypothetical protein AVDCRST_MAG79-2099, partial [uncultured Thermoleophilia bacterium]